MKFEYAMNESVPFEKVENGGTFEHSCKVYIKLGRVYVNGGKNTYNALELNNAELVCIASDMMVRPVRTTLTIY